MILSCGDALFDVFAGPGSSNASIALEARVGGSPLNVAVALSRLDQPSAFLSKISTDSFGRQMLAYLRAEGVNTDLIVATGAPTTLAIVGLDEKGVPAYSFYIEGTADRSLEPGELPAQLPDAVRCIHIGSYATALEPTASSLEMLVTRERGRRFISYDLNIRPSVLPDPESWRGRVARLTRQSHLVKASADDIRFLDPRCGIEDALSNWLSSGASLAIATIGESGAMAAAKGGARARVGAPAVPVVDTVGAGDSFQAALLTWLGEQGHLSGDRAAGLTAGELEQLLVFAVRAAGIACSRRGADMPYRKDL